MRCERPQKWLEHDSSGYRQAPAEAMANRERDMSAWCIAGDSQPVPSPPPSTLNQGGHPTDLLGASSRVVQQMQPAAAQVGLYPQPARGAVVLSVDENTSTLGPWKGRSWCFARLPDPRESRTSLDPVDVRAATMRARSTCGECASARPSGLGLGREPPPIEQLAFEGREGALGERVVVCHRPPPHRRPDSGNQPQH